MKTRFMIILLVTALGVVTGCASQTTQDLQAGPKLTEAQKDAMTEDEKLVIYNSLVREKDQLECKRVARVGSRLKDLVCKTPVEVALERDSAREALRQSRGGSMGGAGPGP